MSPLYLAGLIVAGSGIGFLTGLVGVGGGFLLTPTLKVLFKVPYNIAVGTGLCLIAITTFFSALNHMKKKHVKFLLALFLLVGSLPGSEVGTRTLQLLSKSGAQKMDLVMNLCFVLLLTAAGVMMLIEILRWSRPNENGQVKSVRNLDNFEIKYWFFSGKGHRSAESADVTYLNIPMLMGIGFVVGFFSGFLGTGGAFLLTPILVAIFQLPAVIVIGSDLFLISITSTFAAGSHILKGNVDPQLWLILMIFSVGASQVGAHFSTRFRGPKIRFCFVGVLFVALMVLFWDLIN